MSAGLVLAALLASAAVALALPGPALLEEDTTRRVVPLEALLPGVVVTAGGLSWFLLSGTDVVLVVLLGAVVLTVARALRRRRRAREADLRASRVQAACEAMASDLVAGQPPVICLARAAEEWAELAPAATAARVGADVPTVLRELAAKPGAGALRVLAASWQVAHESGSGLATAISRAASAIRAERRTARLVASELASARATARMLAVLPVGVLLLGAGVGGDPLGFLLGTPPGVGCLALGLLLSWAGLRWLEAIADKVLAR